SLGGLPKRSHIVQNPEAAAMSAGDEVGAETGGVVFHLDIANGNRGHILAQRMPVIAIVKGDPDLSIGRGIEQTFLARILANGVRHGAAGDTVVDLGPR